MSRAQHDIVKAIEKYFYGLHYADEQLLSEVFHPRAIYATADEQTPLIRNMEDYMRVIADRVSPASKKEVRKDVIDKVEIAGENTAFARVRCSIGSRDFVDFLSFIRVDGQWLIISKVFQILEKNKDF